MPPCKIAIACQQGLIRALLRNIVSEAAGVEIAGEACSALELLELLKNSVADLVIMDIGLLKKSGIKTITQINDLFPKIKILAIHKSKPQVSWDLHDCVDGCFSIEYARGELHAAIETIQQES
jgi:DNA-binding NarL/FixJ family response regulator